MKLEISLFKFDKNSDYLPFYTKHFLKITNEITLLDILNTINNENPFGYENDENFNLVVNSIYLKTSTKIEDLVKNFGKDLTIEPISVRRACNDLIINENDFNDKLNILDDFISQEDKRNYQDLKQYYYASNTLNHKSEYIGDSVLLLAADLIQANKENEEAILNILKEQEIGASYHTSLEKRIFNFDSSIEEKIISIQKKLGLLNKEEERNFRIKNTLIIDFGNLQDETEIKHNFKDFNIAYYPANKSEQTNSLLERLDAKILKLDSLKLDLARNTFNKNQEITYCVATTILLDAFDNNADFLLVDNDDDFYLFDYNRKALEKCSGREVILPVIHVNELQKLANGEHKLANETLVKHQINPEII
ncbi:DUF5644 domain-containing protein [Poseidonibacter ostreae]|uniref:DUF5644 domain-containing protein n=1 Tax=Poseidonibacter ostreae TaxID=2654171 RepID=A0ABQ6VNU3_9BACT|nr:DUF5644 domain-containing protein [Poseidonibacter ostreae]KAB7888542.1 hypothetical protein GBG18_12775 [Poseidonibacter ostreae]